jgi:hypothetical protein
VRLQGDVVGEILLLNLASVSSMAHADSGYIRFSVLKAGWFIKALAAFVVGRLLDTSDT